MLKRQTLLHILCCAIGLLYPSLMVANAQTPTLHAYVINLKHSTERYEQIQALVTELGLPYQRIEAVNGRALSPQQVSSVVDKNYVYTMGIHPDLGTIGCSLSHIETWKTFLQSQADYALVLEDDATFTPKQLLKILTKLTEDTSYWDIATLEVGHSGAPVTIKHLASGYHTALYMTKITHSGAYLLSRKSAERLLANALPVGMPIDHYLFQGWKHDLRTVGVEPRVVHQRPTESTIVGSDVTYYAVFARKHVQIFSLKRYAHVVSEAVYWFLYSAAAYLHFMFGHE